MRVAWSGWRGQRTSTVSTQTCHLLFAVWSKGINMRTMPILQHFTPNSFTPVHPSIHLTAARFSCELVWTEKASWVNGKSLVNFVFIFFRRFTAWESEMTAYILLGTVSRSTVKGSLWFEDIVWVKLSRLFLLYMLVHSLWLPNGVKAYQKPHQSRRLSGAFTGCSSASRAVV